MKITLVRNTKKNDLRLSLKTFEQLLQQMADEKTGNRVEAFREAVSQLYDGYSHYKGMDTWTHVYPAAEYVKDGNGNLLFQKSTGLLLLSFSNLADADGVEEAKRSAAFLPSTFAAVESADGLGIHILVKYTDDDGKLVEEESAAEQLYCNAFAVASSVYQAVVRGTLVASSPTLQDEFLMTFDKAPFFNVKASPLKVSGMLKREILERQQVGADVMPDGEEADGDDDKKKEGVKETIQRMIKFLNDKYSFRYNTIMKYTEYMQRDGWQMFRPVDPRMQKQMTLEVQLADIRVSIKDVRNYLESNMISNYYPVDDYLLECDGKWDGKDHIRRLARTVPTDNPYWEDWFYTWFLAMVDQWRGYDRRTYGNSIVPLLISRQGFNKSTFCRRLIPDDMQWGYNDNLVLSEKRQVLQAMSQFLLINLDEFNQIPAKVQQGFLKNLVQLPSVKVKRPYGGHVEEFPRLASFIATSNMDDVLFDPTGNRRFLGVELTGPIDVSERPNYKQLYAQALAALERGDKPYFDAATTANIMTWNSQYQVDQPIEQCFFDCFTVAKDKTEGQYMSVAAIYKELKSKYGATLVGNSLISFGRKLKNIDGIIHRHSLNGTEYLIVRRS
ncbi:VapE domain-containing protein [Prevotella sp.]|uniref:VapE domain-containing protein n=1 Tax=Prevotella sp. TaxID=59823 RepID=UPI003AB947FD